MASSSSCSTSSPCVPPRSYPFSSYPLELEKESQEVIAHFKSLMEINQEFKKLIEERTAENYLGFITQGILKRPLWISPTGDCYPIFLDRVIAESKGGDKKWVCALDLTKKKVRALGMIKEALPFGPRKPNAWHEYLVVTEYKIGPKCHGFHSTQELSFSHPRNTKLCTSYILQAKYDQDLAQFLDMERRKYITDRPMLKRIAEDVTVRLITEVARLNEKGIIHRDIKPDNFLVKGTKTGTYKLKVTDLEFAHKPGVSSRSVGTRECVSPQYASQILSRPQHGPFTVSALNEGWALGITILKIRTAFGLNKKIDLIFDRTLPTRKIFENICSLFDRPDWLYPSEPEDPYEQVMWHLLRVSEMERWSPQKAHAYIAPFALPS
ncbi:MAG: hypothetical protein K2P51_05510 [Rhabdochlamydiaceae bacterium]|nr:hypothetical protein [Rhabdochlamydiaceae bacterium]